MVVVVVQVGRGRRQMTMTETKSEKDSEPEYSDETIREVRADLEDLVEDDQQLSLVCTNAYAQQVDNPLTDDFAQITLFMSGEPGSGATKATIIQKVLDSDLPLRLYNTSEGHGQIEFKVDK